MPIIDESDIVSEPSATPATAGPKEVPESDIVPDAQKEPEYQGFFSGLNDKYMHRISNIFGGIEGASLPDDVVSLRTDRGAAQTIDNAGRIFGQELAFGGDIVTEAVKRLYHWLPEESQNRIETAAKRIAQDSWAGPVVLKALKGSGEAYDRLARAYPEETKNLEAVLNIFSALGGGKAAKETGAAVKGVVQPVAKEGVNIARDVSEIAARSLSKDSEQAINSTIKETMQRAVKMSSKNKGEWSAIEKSFSKANDAVKDIVDHQKLLTYSDDAGNVIKTGLPASMEEWSQAISQGKQRVFSEFDALKTEAEGKGGMVNISPTIKKLDDIANDPSILRQRPEVAEYAQKRAVDLAVGETALTPSEAQREIAILNDKLKPYYADPGYEGAHKIWIDEMIARDMRAELDKKITSLTGEKYQKLKNLYGAYSAIEPEVSHRAIIFGRQNIKGLPDYIGTPISTVMAIKGIMTGNPVELAAAGATWSAKKMMKRANDADRMVEAMFQKVSKHMGRQAPFSPESLTFKRAMGKEPMPNPKQFELSKPTPKPTPKPNIKTGKRDAYGILAEAARKGVAGPGAEKAIKGHISDVLGYDPYGRPKF